MTLSATSSLVDVLDRVLDKGIVIDAWVRVSVVGIELVTLAHPRERSHTRPALGPRHRGPSGVERFPDGTRLDFVVALARS